MTRKYIDCSEAPDSHCSLRLSGSEDEVLKAAREHAVSSHGHKDGSQLIQELRSYLKDEPVASQQDSPRRSA